MNKAPSSSYKIRFTDCDMFGHLNNARYIDYMINAREDHLKDAYDFNIMEFYGNNLGWVTGSHEIAYLKPAFYNEMVTIRSRLIRAESYLLHVEITMTDESDKQLKAVLRTKLVPVNIKTGRKEPHAPEFLEWASSLVDDSMDIQPDLQERIKALTGK